MPYCPTQPGDIIAFDIRYMSWITWGCTRSKNQ